MILKVADYKIKLVFSSDKKTYLRRMIENYYRGFMQEDTFEKPDFTVDFVKRDQDHYLGANQSIKFYKLIGRKKITSDIKATISHLQLLIREVLQDLLGKRGFFIHTAANLIGREVYLFLGDSGAGKSTISRLLSKEFTKLADDSAIIKKEEKLFMLYQTPFKEKRGIRFYKSFNSFPISKILFIKKSNAFRLVRIKSKEEALTLLLKQVYTDKQNSKMQIKNILNLTATFDEFYYLYFRKDGKKLAAFIKGLS